MKLKKEKLNSREMLFCKYYKIYRDPTLAAFYAGYKNPQKSAKKLLVNAEIEKQLKKLPAFKLTLDEVASGLCKIAFSNNTDAIALALKGEVEENDLSLLDLSGISEIKVQKGAISEIKFFDKVKALEKLSALLSDDDSDGAQSFFRALTKSAKTIDMEEA